MVFDAVMAAPCTVMVSYCTKQLLFLLHIYNTPSSSSQFFLEGFLIQFESPENILKSDRQFETLISNCRSFLNKKNR